MSWRSILIILVLLFGAAGISGMQLGDWLVSRAPTTSPPPHATGQDADSVLDADGRPYVAQPPQPRLNGTLGVPEPHRAEWNIPMVSVLDKVKDPNVLVSRAKATPESMRLANRSNAAAAANARPDDIPPPPADIRDIRELRAALADDPGYPTAPPPQASRTGGGDWQSALRRELQVCADTMGFFERPSCAWAARRKYCEPNNAWGTSRDCPERR